MELRWLKGKWGFGSYKLQYRPDYDSGDMLPVWQDVPIAEKLQEKTLEEKFKDVVPQNSLTHQHCGSCLRNFVEIAEAHFKEAH